MRIWPYTLTFEAEKAVAISRDELESHLRSVMSDLELRIHRKLLERLDLYEFETRRSSDTESILLLENNIEDGCRELAVFGPGERPLIEELTGLTLRDHLINQLIMDSGPEEFFDLASLTSNEFDVPATLVPELRGRTARAAAVRRADEPGRVPRRGAAQVQRVEIRFAEVFPLVRPHLHHEARRYIVLVDAQELDLKDGSSVSVRCRTRCGPPRSPKSWSSDRTRSTSSRDGVIEKSGRRFISEKVTESIIERIVAQVGRRIDKSQPLVDARLPDGSRVNAIIPPLSTKGPCLTIRKFPVQRMTMDDLVEMESVSTAAARFLRACVIDRRNILVSGGTGTGKTTLLNVLSSFILYKERIITVEDTLELVGCTRSTWCRWRARCRMSRGRARTRSATSCGTQQDAPIASSSANAAAPSRSTWCRR